MSCRLGSGDNKKILKKIFTLGQWGFTAWCATRYVCSEVGVQTSTYVVGHCSTAQYQEHSVSYLCANR